MKTRQPKQLTTAAEHSGLEYELHRFGNRHEEPSHLRMRHRHRPSVANLSREGRHDAALAPQDVAEPHRNEVATVLQRRIVHGSGGVANGDEESALVLLLFVFFLR